MGERTTLTIPIYANSFIVDTYLIPKPKDYAALKKTVIAFFDSMDIINNITLYSQDSEFKNYYNYYYKTYYYYRQVNYFFCMIPIKELEDLHEHLKEIYPITLRLRTIIKRHERQLTRTIRAITGVPTDDSVIQMKTLVKTLNLLYKMHYKGIIKDDIPEEKKAEYFLNLWWHLYIPFVPVLVKTRSLYFNMMFNRYLYVIDKVAKKNLSFTSYYFIIKNLAHEATHYYFELYKGFEDLQYLKDDDNIHLLGGTIRYKLYRFILFIRVYHRVVRDDISAFTEQGYLRNLADNSRLQVYYLRENKKYFYTFFGKNADFKKFTGNEIETFITILEEKHMMTTKNKRKFSVRKEETDDSKETNEKDDNDEIPETII
jgi:hypothetical protein